MNNIQQKLPSFRSNDVMYLIIDQVSVCCGDDLLEQNNRCSVSYNLVSFELQTPPMASCAAISYNCVTDRPSKSSLGFPR